MILENYAPLAGGLVIFTAIILLMSRYLHLSLIALGAQYVGIFGLVALTWPLEMAVIKLIAGWIGAAVLGLDLSAVSVRTFSAGKINLSRGIFRILLALIFVFSVWSFVPEVAQLLVSATYDQILAGLMLCTFGILQFGISTHPLRVVFGLLTLLSGFEILFATINTVSFVAGFLAILNLGIALMGAYWLKGYEGGDQL